MTRPSLLAMRMERALLMVLALSLAGCVSETVKSTSVPGLKSPAYSVPEDELLDVAVAIFDPGLDVADEEERIYPEVRRAEARYIPKLLTEVLENSGAWGAVRVVPDDTRITERCPACGSTPPPALFFNAICS